MPPEPLAGAERFLLVRLDNVGDVVILAPAARAIRAAQPAATIGLLCSPAGATAAPLLPWIDEVRTESVAWQDASRPPGFEPARERAFLERLTAGRWDAALIFTSFSQTAFAAGYAAYLAGIPIRAGQAIGFGGAVLTHQVEPIAWEAHEADRDLRLLEGLGIPVVSRAPHVVVPEAAHAATAALLAADGLEAGEGYVLVVPGASCASRRYPVSRYAVAAARIRAVSGLRIVVAGTAAEHDLAGPVLDAVPDAISLVGRTTVAQLAALVARSAVVVCGNSAAMHLADALARPVVAIFAGTDLESQWAPRRAPAVLLRRPTPCHPCYRMDCPFGLECLDVDPAEVADAAIRLLDIPGPKTEDPWVAYAS